MREKPLKKNSRFYLGMVLNVVEGMLSGFNFLLLYEAMKMLWNGTINSPSLLRLSLFLGGIFILRIVIYSVGYTQSQIGGAAVSNRTRLFLGDKIKRIPLSRFTQGQTGQYINIVTSDVNNYEKILTHTVGDIVKHITFCTMMIIFVGCIWLPGGIILACVELVLIPFLWLSFRVVRKYGTEKNAVSAETVSSIVEYATGIQTFRAYGIGGTKNETVTSTLKHFSDVSYNYEKHGIPTNAIQCIFLWIGLPVMIWAASIPMLSGKLDPISYLLICMLPMLLAKLSDSISRGLMSYKNLKISKDKVVDIIEEPEETGSMEPLQTATHEINFDSVDFSYVPGEPVLKHATFTVPDQKLTAIVGDSGSGKSTILNLIAKYYEATGGTISIGGKPINHVAAERVLEQISIQSPSLDAVFGYEHKYIEMVRSGINLALEPKKVYTIPFDMNKQKYELIFQIGHNHRLGLLEDFSRKGELILPLHTNEIQECYDIATVLCRLAMFMTSHTDILFKRITLYRKEVSVGWFYCPFISEDAVDRYNGLFYEFDIMKYIPKLLNNIALDSGNKITQSIPLGHLGNFDSMFTPQRFVEQIVAFEYLFDKLEHKKAQNLQFPLKKELEYMFNEYPQLLSQTNLSAEKVSNQIKEIRRTIAHGYAYYYDFKNDRSSKYLMILLDKLIRCMSLKLIGFSNDDISNFMPFYP